MNPFFFLLLLFLPWNPVLIKFLSLSILKFPRSPVVWLKGMMFRRYIKIAELAAIKLLFGIPDRHYLGAKLSLSGQIEHISAVISPHWPAPWRVLQH